MYLSSVSSRLLLHDTVNWDIKKSYGCYEGICRDISWSDDGKYLLQVNPKGVVEILSTADNDVRSLQHVPLRDTWSASFHREGHRLVALGTKSGNVLIWDTKNKNITKSFPIPTQQSSVNFVSFNAKNNSLAATMQNGDTVIYGLATNVPVLTVKLQCSKSISAMKFHPESRAILGLATDEGHVVLRDITTNKDKAYFENVHASPVCDFAYSLINKDVMLSCGYDKVMHVYDTRLQHVVSSLRSSYPMSTIAINSENQVAFGTINGTIFVYDLRDLSYPLRILRGHEEEVRKVAFQPLRKKSLSTEVSLREDTENVSPQQLHSPVTKRNSDKFFLSVDSPVMNGNHSSSQSVDNRADSFLVMMGLDKSGNDCDLDINNTHESDRKSDKYETKNRQLDAEKNITKASTPLSMKNTENTYFTTPILKQNVIEEENVSVDINNHLNIADLPKATDLIDPNAIGDLKEFINLSLSTVADDNRNYFLHVMMALIKQKLYLEKQLTAMNDQMLVITQNQNALAESNRKLALEIEKLKTKNNHY